MPETDKPLSYSELETAYAQALVRLEEREWQPIETAPKDGSAIWIGHPECARIAYWENDWIDLDRQSSLSVYFTPTHWQPLPKPPVPTLKEIGE
jgi:hypothetical protein